MLLMIAEIDSQIPYFINALIVVLKVVIHVKLVQTLVILVRVLILKMLFLGNV